MDWMVENLKNYPEEVINYAFDKWLKESEEIPTPANIYQLCENKFLSLNRKEWWN